MDNIALRGAINKASARRLRDLLLGELVLGNTLAHSSSRRDTAGDSHQQVICVLRATPFLMREHVGAELALLTLDDLDVRLHAVLGEVLREEVADVRVRVQATELRKRKRKCEYSRKTRVK